MSSPLVKITDHSWSLSCLCCNCAQEVRDTLRMEIGPAFVEYNHRFTCPECQTYNQILLTRAMFDTAQVMILPSMAHNQSTNNDSLGYSPDDKPVFDSANDDWSKIDSGAGSSPFSSSSPFNFNLSGEPEPPAGGEKNRPPIPSFEAAPQMPTLKPPIPPPPAKPPKKVGSGSDKDAEILNAFNFNKSAAAPSSLGKQPEPDSESSGQPGSIKLPGGRELPINRQTALAGGAALIVIAGLCFFFFGRKSAPPPPPAPVANKTTPAKPTTPGTNPSTAKPALNVVPPAPPAPVVEAQMIDIPGGEYIIGNVDGTEYERPSHKVSIKPFQIDIREVTREEYAKFIAETKHRAPKFWVNGQYKGNGRLPVTDVDWNDAVAYAKWAGKRLPTEAEWEIASSGKDHLLYPWGNEWSNNRANTREVATDGPQPAGTFAGRSAFGLYDMSGNVWEWTASEPEPYPGSSMKIANAKDLRVIRGGAYNEGQKVASTYARNWVEAIVTSPALGFRCAKDIP